MKKTLLKKLQAFTKKSQEAIANISFRNLSGKIFSGTLMVLGGVTLAVIILVAGFSATTNHAHALSFGHKDGHSFEGITKEDAIAKAKKHFAKMDDDSNGQLTDDELTHQDCYGKDESDKRNTFVHQMISQVDANNDDVITEKEFVNHASVKFSSYDTDGNGEISEDEGNVAHEVMQAERKKVLFQIIDTDGNGIISAEEFEATEGKRGHSGKHGRGRGHGHGHGHNGYDSDHK